MVNRVTGRVSEPLRTEVLLVLLATGAGLLESLLPRPVPFMKPGLANVVTVAAVMRYGMMMGIRINILRATGSALFLGTLATPTFALSLSGSIASAVIMGLVCRYLSVTGTSVSGSLFSVWTQLLVATFLLPGLPLLELVLPVSLWGFLSGTFTGILAVVLLRKGFPWTVQGVDSV